MGDHLKAKIKQVVTEELEIKNAIFRATANTWTRQTSKQSTNTNRSNLKISRKMRKVLFAKNREVQMYEDMD